MPKLNQNQLPSTTPIYVKRTLTSNEIKALRATPIELVAAPGAGYMIVPVFGFIKYHGDGATAYVCDAGGDLELLLGTNQPFGMACKTNENILEQTADNTGSFNMQGIVAFGDFAESATMENLALNIKNVGGAEYTTGTGTADVVVHYLVVPV
jgi:hypothetical protein